MSRPEEKRRAIDAASRALVRGAAALTEWPSERDALGLALLHTAIALLRIVEADSDGQAIERVCEVLEAEMSRREVG